MSKWTSCKSEHLLNKSFDSWHRIPRKTCVRGWNIPITVHPNVETVHYWYWTCYGRHKKYDMPNPTQGRSQIRSNSAVVPWDRTERDTRTSYETRNSICLNSFTERGRAFFTPPRESFVVNLDLPECAKNSIDSQGRRFMIPVMGL